MDHIMLKVRQHLSILPAVKIRIFPREPKNAACTAFAWLRDVRSRSHQLPVPTVLVSPKWLCPSPGRIFPSKTIAS